MIVCVNFWLAQTYLLLERVTVNSNGFCCNKVHAAERMTVNHDVAGSSPAGGAISREWIYPKIYSFLIC